MAFPDNIFKCIFLNENAWILFTISQNFVPKCPINNIPSSVQIMAWRRSGDKPFSGPMMALFTEWIYTIYLSISFRVASQALGAIIWLPHACEVALTDMDKID